MYIYIKGPLAPFTFDPTPNTLRHTPSTLHPAPRTLFPRPYTPYTFLPKPCVWFMRSPG